MEALETSELLHRYSAQGSNDAFVELMRRYMDLVYGAALRRLNGDAGLAQDVVQRVFTELAQHARKLRAESTLGGWLYKRATRIAADIHKSECRRRLREHAAASLAEIGGTAPSAREWADATPHLEDAIGCLSAADRDALVLRFIEDRPLRSVGAALGVSDDAAQKRISRALGKLRRQLARRGVACTAGGLALTLSRKEATAVPGEALQRIFQMCRSAAAAGMKKNCAALLIPALAMKPAAIVAVALVAVIGIAIPFILPAVEEAAVRKKAARDRELPSPPPHGVRGPGPAKKIARAEVVPGRQSPPVALLPGMTPEERETTLRTARAKAEKATMDRYEEKMERLRRKLKLTPEQDAAVSAHHLAQRDRWIEYLTGAAVGEADPKYYHLDVSYRFDVPPAVAEGFSLEQKQLLTEHETNRRANFLEATTNGELGSLALKLDLPEAAKEGLFQRLSAINASDLFEDYSGVTDLAGIAAQADRDLGRRRAGFAEVLDERQMREWEAVAASYRAGLLRRFGHRESEAAAASNATNSAKGAG
jgi:RNA polymerase sigma factor (sigma-70 family)